MLGGVKMGSGMMGKLGRAWVGAWVVHGMVHWCWWWGGDVDDVGGGINVV